MGDEVLMDRALTQFTAVLVYQEDEKPEAGPMIRRDEHVVKTRHQRLARSLEWVPLRRFVRGDLQPGVETGDVFEEEVGVASSPVPGPHLDISRAG